MSNIDNFTRADYLNAQQKLRQIDPIAPNASWVLGHTKDGRPIYFPNSYRAGYNSVLFGNLTIALDFAIIGQLSDGSLAYLPSFREGARDCLNELRMTALAEASRRSFEQIDAMKQQQDQLQNKVEELQRQLSKLEEENNKKGNSKQN